MGPGHPFVGIKSYTEEQLRPRGRDCRSQGRTQSAAEGNGALVSEGTEGSITSITILLCVAIGESLCLSTAAASIGGLSPCQPCGTERLQSRYW